MTSTNHRPVECGQVRIEFVARRHIERVPWTTINVPTGHVRYATPEVTALDLVISRALASMYMTPGLAEELAFRGGTALYWDFDRAMVTVCEQLIERLPGHAWAGRP